MRREDFTIDVETDERPQLRVTFEGTPETLRARFGGDDPLEADDIDVAYRETQPGDPGVLSVTDRLTGEFVFEAPVSTETLTELIVATSDREEGNRHYTLQIGLGEEQPFRFEKEMLLVYDATGSLDREHSLIPGSVEL